MVRLKHDTHLLNNKIDYITFASFRRHLARVRLRRMLSISPSLWFIFGFGTACIIGFCPKADSYKDARWCRREGGEFMKDRMSWHRPCLTHPMTRKAFEGRDPSNFA